ncbi:MAG: S8 family peptidase [Firmicutes bacterium]|nr:S8 family peptidase [Bacillota bacterium]
MRITAKLADKISIVKPEELINVIIKLRVFDRELVSELLIRPHVSIRQVIGMAKAIALAIPAGEIEKIAAEPWIERIEEDEKVYAVLDESVQMIGAPSAWDFGFSGKKVKLAIIDTGIDRRHPDFANRIIAINDFTLEGFKDSNGHGSHVTGIAAGSGVASGGRYKGIAPDALIIAGKVLQADGTGRMSDVMAAVEWAVNLGADIINLSLSTGEPSDGNDGLCEICDMAVEAGVVVCAAAGNEGPDRRTIGSPAAARRVIAVGAATANGLVAEFSSRGPTADDRLKPELVAPGVDIISVRAKGTRAGKPLDANYTSATGTSMAVPHVSGVAALLLEANRKASPQLIKEALLHTATDLEVDDYAQGAGMLAAEPALRYVQTHENPPEPIDQSPPRSASLMLLAGLYETFSANRRIGRSRARVAAGESTDSLNEEPEASFLD